MYDTYALVYEEKMRGTITTQLNDTAYFSITSIFACIHMRLNMDRLSHCLFAIFSNEKIFAKKKLNHKIGASH